MEVFTDKLVAKIPSTCTGVVREVSYEVDDVCLVGHKLIKIESEEEGETEEASAAQTSSSSSSDEESGETATRSSSSSSVTHGPGKYSIFL